MPPSLRGLFFLQNGPGVTHLHNPLDGRGHITCVDFASGRATEVHVPPSPHTVSLTDVVERPWEVTLKSLLNGRRIHGGTANTAVVEFEGRWHAVEESSFSYELRFDGTGITGGRFTRHKLPAHAAPGGGRYHYLATASPPLTVDGVGVDWWPHKRPFAMHSCGRLDDLYVFPRMVTCFGHYESWMRGEQRLPLEEVGCGGWLVYDAASRRHLDIEAWVPSDAFHVAAVRPAGPSKLAVFASHVTGFAAFAQGDAPTPTLSFEKHVLDLREGGRVVDRTVYPAASGDFPNMVDDRTVLLNRMRRRGGSGGGEAAVGGGASEIAVFDLLQERVVRTVHLPHATTDVLCPDGRFLVYGTSDAVVIYDMTTELICASFPIPHRHGQNFHASLLRAPRG